MNTSQRIASRAKRNPAAWDCSVIRAHQEQPEANADRIMCLVRLAFEKLKHGSEDPRQFDRLAGALNIGLIRAEAIDPLAEETMLAGLEAVRRCDAIFARHQRYGFTGPDLTIVADAVNLYEDILRLSTPRMMEDALEEVARRMIEQAQGEMA